MCPVANRMRVLTWHVHGNYLWYLTQAPHDFYLVTDVERSVHHTGRSGTLPWGDNVYEASVDRIRDLQFDVVLYQSRAEFENERMALLTPAQRRLPALYLEHDPPQQNPTDQRHWADATGMTIVHVTAFNALMWTHEHAASLVIEHGVKLLTEAHYDGRLRRGIVVVNNLRARGRRLGADLFDRFQERVPLTLVGMGSRDCGGHGEVANHELPGFMSQYRFFFNPIRWTSLGLSVIEAMMVGLPIVGLATTEMPTVIANGVSGWLDTRPHRLVEVMHQLLEDPALARRWGEEARRVATLRFNIERFAADWDHLLRSLGTGDLPPTATAQRPGAQRTLTIGGRNSPASGSR